MSWLWPRKLNSDDKIIVRVAPVLHSAAIAFASFGLVISFLGMALAGDREIIPYVAVGIMWFCVAMLGRGIRYILARE